MTKDELVTEINVRLGAVLKRARLRSRLSIPSIARSLGWSEFEVRTIELRPARTPGHRLYQLVHFYGGRALSEAQLQLIEIDELGRQYRESQCGKLDTSFTDFHHGPDIVGELNCIAADVIADLAVRNGAIGRSLEQSYL